MPTEAPHSTPLPQVLRIAASALIVASTLAAAAKSWSHWHNYLAVRDYLAGSTESVDVTFLDRAGQFSTWIMLAAAVVFVWWLWEARRTAELLSIAQHEHGLGWVIGAWICPVVNFWFPRRIVSDIRKASRPVDGPNRLDLRLLPGSPLIDWWWSFFVAYNLIDELAIGVLYGTPSSDQLQTVAVIDTVSMICKVAAAVLIIMVMGQITRAQAHYRPLTVRAAT
jgi:hypothetical protein